MLVTGTPTASSGWFSVQATSTRPAGQGLMKPSNGTFRTGRRPARKASKTSETTSTKIAGTMNTRSP